MKQLINEIKLFIRNFHTGLTLSLFPLDFIRFQLDFIRFQIDFNRFQLYFIRFQMISNEFIISVFKYYFFFCF